MPIWCDPVNVSHIHTSGIDLFYVTFRWVPNSQIKFFLAAGSVAKRSDPARKNFVPICETLVVTVYGLA